MKYSKIKIRILVDKDNNYCGDGTNASGSPGAHVCSPGSIASFCSFGTTDGVGMVDVCESGFENSKTYCGTGSGKSQNCSAGIGAS